MRALAISLALLIGSAAATAQVNGRQIAARPDAEPLAKTTSVRSLYVVHCAGCHGRDGAGSVQGNVPDMRRLGDFLRVPGGREFVVSVPGVMGSGMSDAQVADVTNWVLETMARESVPPEHRPYDANEVGQARAKPLVDVAKRRGQLVSAASELGIEIK